MKYKHLFAMVSLVVIILLLTGCDSAKYNYQKAQNLLSEDKYAEAAEILESIGSYEDASTLAMYCKACADCETGNFSRGISTLKKIGDYKDCSHRISYYTARMWDERTVGTTYFEDMEKAKGLYNENPLYLDSTNRIAALDERIDTTKKLLYSDAVAAAENGQLEEAIESFERLGDYVYSEEYITFCELRIEEDKLIDTLNPEAAYDIAVQYKELYESTHRWLSVCNERATALLDSYYNGAVALMNEEKYSEAYDTFLALDGYKDSELKAESIQNKAIAEKCANGEVGFYITFGHYEQDNITSNGQEDIEWLVLANQGNRLLVISRYILDCQPYHINFGEPVTWETCSLRKWLNNDFLTTAFNSTEQSQIPTITVTADGMTRKTKPGNDTQDKIFLLSDNELQEYMPEYSPDSQRLCNRTSYAVGQCRNTYNDPFSWWLRTICDDLESAGTVSNRDSGHVSQSGTAVHIDDEGVRPALWINLEP